MSSCLRYATLFSVVLVLALSGCRREDIRECEIAVPQLTAANRPAMIAALTKYAGVDSSADGIVFDEAKKTVRVRYDSMKIAQANLRYELEAVK